MSKQAPDYIVSGYSSRHHLLLDLDNTTPYKAIKLTEWILSKWKDLHACLLMISSTQDDIGIFYMVRDGNVLPHVSVRRWNIHAIFDGWQSTKQVRRRMTTLSDIGVISKVYHDISKFRNSMTLRISSKLAEDRYRPVPAYLTYLGNPEPQGGIAEYLVQWQTFANLPDEILNNPILGQVCLVGER